MHETDCSLKPQVATIRVATRHSNQISTSALWGLKRGGHGICRNFVRNLSDACREMSGFVGNSIRAVPFFVPETTLRAKKDKKKTHTQNEPFSLESFILGVKLSFSLENFNPGPCFSAAREGLGMKKPFSIENLIPYWKLDFFNIASRDWIFSILEPSGKESAEFVGLLSDWVEFRRNLVRSYRKGFPNFIAWALLVLLGQVGSETSSNTVCSVASKKTTLTTIDSQVPTCILMQRLLQKLCLLGARADLRFLVYIFRTPSKMGFQAPELGFFCSVCGLERICSQF